MSVELVLAAVSAADLCLKYGKTLMRVYRDIKDANEAVQSKLLIVEAIWSKTAIQVEFVKRVAQVLDEEHCRIHLEVLEVLQSKLTVAVKKIESVVKTGPESGVKRWKYARLREVIDDSIEQLQQWQSIFDPTWYLILRMGNKFIDDELSKTTDVAQGRTSSAYPISSSGATSNTLSSAQSFRKALKGEGACDIHVTLPESGLDWGSVRKIEYSSTALIQRKGSEKMFAIDTIVCDTSYDISRLRADTEGLAKKLKKEEIRAFGLLSCKGVIKKKNPETQRLGSMYLAFQLPHHGEHNMPVSLRRHLLQDRSCSLSRVLDVAKQLARAVSFVHTFDFVHKNIRPETILVFPDDKSVPHSQLGSAFLVGFDSFRNVNFHTMKVGDKAWERNLYRHPTRQGIQAQESYIMQHDVYSLGVCLLELGLWESFVNFQLEADGSTIPGPKLGLTPSDFDFQPGNVAQTLKIKEHLVELARNRLPPKMGDIYTSVVVTCLTCLDEDNDDFGGEEMQDEDGILVGVRFIEKVLLKLGSISM
ncbi:het-s domain protein [Colletotrichum truncatum]|uniref:Het-s domain protein n=1 Tax=Colletotrichum truncatum TaxID=5467 RepID=A0ACC3YZ08_COLTU|nr:het-s domain protein [Colletotrichum truncatum]KAF6781753.1 het-s domain protein [Colletotrichum truncatum]